MYQNGFVVAVKINGRTVEEKDGKIVMPFDSEYSLMLKNRNDRKAVARVYIDGEEVTKSGRLILDGNNSLNLERYVEDMNNGAKFKFVPLGHNEVKDKGDSEKGYVEVRFQLVKPTVNQFIIHEEHFYHKHHHWPIYDHYTVPFYTDAPFIGFASSGDAIGKGMSCGNFTASGAGNASLEATNTGAKVSLNEKVTVEGNQLIEEAGATIKGSNSSQKFSYAYVGELEAQETVIRFQLVGTTDEKVTAQYIKTHCTECGKKYDVNDNFCAKCGIKK